METKMNDNGTVNTNWSPIGAQGKPSRLVTWRKTRQSLNPAYSPFSLSIWLLKYGLGLAILIILLLTSLLIWSNSQKGLSITET